MHGIRRRMRVFSRGGGEGGVKWGRSKWDFTTLKVLFFLSSSLTLYVGNA